MDLFVRSRWRWLALSPSRAAAFEVEAGFPGGNVATPRRVSSRHLQFAAAAHDSPHPLWFYFRVDGAPGPQLCCELVNADACLGPPLGWRTARPVYSPDGVNWKRVDAGDYLERRGSFRFQVPVAGKSVWIAYCYPYTVADLNRFLDRLPAAATVSELCRSDGGRAVPYVCLGGQDSPRSAIWVLARQHAGESPASFTVEGLLDGLAGFGADELRHTAFHIVPMLDVDGVEEGRFGKDQAPVDFNRDWHETPSWPAVRAVIERIRSSRAKSPIELVLDLHAPHHGDPACYFFSSRSEVIGKESYQTQRRFLEFLGRDMPQKVGFCPTDFRESPPPPGSARQYLAGEAQAPVLTLEMSYHQAQSKQYLTPADYRAFGLALARAAARLLSERTPA